MMHKTLFAVAFVASLATASPAPWDEVTVTNTKYVTSCSGPAPTCGVSTSSATPASITSAPSGYTVITKYSTSHITVTACPATVQNCPARHTSVITKVIPVTTFVCPIAEASSYTHPPTSVTYLETTETIYSTSHITVTSCPAPVQNCPARKTSTVYPASTTVYSVPVTVYAYAPASTFYSAEAAVTASSVAQEEETVTYTNTAVVTSCPGGVSCPAITSAVAAVPYSSVSAAPQATYGTGSNTSFSSPQAQATFFKGAAGKSSASFSTVFGLSALIAMVAL